MKKTNMISVFFALVFCVFGFTTANAQLPGPGVDPNSVIMDHGIESGSITGWRATSVDRGQTQSVTVADAQLGDPIKFGRYALKLTVDYTTAQPDQTITSGFITQNNQIAGNSSSSSGTRRIGFWCYVCPDQPGIQGAWFRCSTRPIGASSGINQIDMVPSSINWTGWKYVYVDVPANHEFHPSNGIRIMVLKGYPNYFMKGYLIADNIRTYSPTYPEDVTPPTINTFTANGQAVTGEFDTRSFTFEATFEDGGSVISGMNYTKTKISIDGTDYKLGDTGFAIDSVNNRVTLSGLNLSNDTHTATVYVEDRFGHFNTKSGTFTVNATGGSTTFSVEPDAKAKIGRPFQLKINTSDATDVKKLEIVMNINSFGSVAATGGIAFAPSAQSGSSYSYDAYTGNLTITINNDPASATFNTLATVTIDVSRYISASDALTCTPVSSKATFANDETSLFTLFTQFSRPIEDSYKFTVLKRVVGAGGEVQTLDLTNNVLPNANVIVVTESFGAVETVNSGAEGIAKNMTFTSAERTVRIFVEKNGDYSYMETVRTLAPKLTAAPTYIRSGVTANPNTSKTITWMANPVASNDAAILKLAKKADGEAAFREHTGTTRIAEYNAVSGLGVTRSFKVTVNGLTPGTEYIYKVGDGTNWSATREFTTTINDNKFSFCIFGDVQGTSTGDMGRFVSAANIIGGMTEKPVLGIQVGDFNDSDDRFDLMSLNGYLVNTCVPFSNINWAAGYGNHEYMGNPDADNVKFWNGHPSPEPSTKYNAVAVGTGSYYVEIGNLLFINLDWEHHGVGGNDFGTVMQEQAKYLAEILKNSTKTWKIVNMHYPIYPDEFTSGAKNVYPPVFDQYGVQMFLCGHGHTYQRVQVKNGAYLVPADNRRTFTPVIGGTIYMQAGDMKTSNAQGRWFHCEVEGKKMTVNIYDYNNNRMNDESFVLYASEMGQSTVNFGVESGQGTLKATVDGSEIATGSTVSQTKQVTFTATPAGGQVVKNWKVNGKLIEQGNVLKLYPDGDLTVNVIFDSPTATQNVFAPNLNVYPNPFKETFYVDGAESGILKVIDITGATVYSQKVNGTTTSINLNGLGAGAYFLRLESNGEAKVVKLMKH